MARINHRGTYSIFAKQNKQVLQVRHRVVRLHKFQADETIHQSLKLKHHIQYHGGISDVKRCVAILTQMIICMFGQS